VGAPDADAYRAMSEALDARCREIGRDPSEIRRSLIKGCVIGRDLDEQRARVVEIAKVNSRLTGDDPDTLLASARQRWFVGTPNEIVAQMRPFAEAGVELFMLQHFALDDRDALELLAAEVAPGLAEIGVRR
jgi:alkanesulfonate monooxygenase